MYYNKCLDYPPPNLSESDLNDFPLMNSGQLR